MKIFIDVLGTLVLTSIQYNIQYNPIQPPTSIKEQYQSATFRPS
jgi:hypothetical protein